MDNIKIYYINLDNSPLRNNFMQEQFRKFNLEATRFSAIDGEKLNKNLLDTIYAKLKKKNPHYSIPKVGEIGVFYSHKKLYETIAQQNEEFALILEDDVLIKKELIEDLEKILPNLKSSQMLDLSGKKGFFCSRYKKISNELLFFKCITPALGMQGRIIGKEAAARLNSFLKEYQKPIDTILQDIYRHNITLLTTNKKYITHNYKNLGGSTIQTKNKKNINSKLRQEFLRPLYRAKTHILNSYFFLFRKLNER